MAKPRSVHQCSACGAEQAKWAGQCGTCGEWNTLGEQPVAPSRSLAAVARLELGDDAVAITDVADDAAVVVPTGLSELDRVLGGGLVPGSVTLLGGEPGVGKSTVVLQFLAAQARAGARSLYVTGEESTGQVASRARRLDALCDGIMLAPETSLPRVLARMQADRPAVCVVDSIQTLHDPESESAPGTVSQVRDCAHQLAAAAKATGVTVVLVGHVTKEGVLAGPRVLEHVVDTVLQLEGDRHGELRVLRAVKHRFGSTQEIGLFSMGPDGFSSVADPSALFLSDRRCGVPGSVVVPAIEGHRPLLVEVQALVTHSQLTQPRRSAQGLDGGRLSLLLAVLHKHVGVSTASTDVYAMAVGGVRVNEPGVDLALCGAVVSSVEGQACPEELVMCGEVGLGGELRRMSRMEQRLSEAARHGFNAAIVPRSGPASHPGIEVMRVPSLDAALTVAGLV